MSYRKEIFDLAIHTLAGIGTIQERLVQAATDHLLLLKPEEIPSAAQTQFKDFIRALTKEKLHLLGPEGSIKETVNLMDDQEAHHYVEEIFKLYDFILCDEDKLCE
jgi:hypothetical protein